MQVQAGVDEDMIFAMVLARRKALEEARSRSRKARLELARSGRRATVEPVLSLNAPPPIEGEYVKVTDEDDTPLNLPYYDTEEWDG